jgi:hypothetical protein
LSALLGVTLAGCSRWPRRWSERPCCIDTKPVVRRQPIWWHLFDVTVLEPIEQPFTLVRPARKLAGSPIRALNMTDGSVSGSAFFTNRDPAALTPEAVRWGPSTPDDAPMAPLTITKAKLEGKTAGFFVTDSRGVRYLFKLDPANAPELLSGAEAVTSKLLYALGYNVPSYEVALIRPEDLQLKEGAMDRGALDAVLKERLREGTVRVSASRLLEGEILGPAKFKKFRDCADVRALRLAYAWVNNIDTKDHNSLLVWDGARTVGYLIDFGTSLGADAGTGGPKHPCAGWLNTVDMREMGLKLVTLGQHRPPCDYESPDVSKEIGRFSARFDPERWKPYAPNLAFKEMNRDDAEWMARRIGRLSAAQLGAAVSAGRYSDPDSAVYLVRMLEARRQAILDRYVDDDDDEQEEPKS